MAVKRVNMTLDPETYEAFRKYGERKGIKISTWVNMKMREFVEKEQAEELKEAK